MKAILLFLLLPFCVAAQTGFNGIFTSTTDGVESVMNLTSNGNTLDGTFDEGEFHLGVTGFVNENKMDGELADIATGTVVADFTGTMVDNNTIDFTLRMMGQEQKATFKRKGTDAKANNTTSPPATKAALDSKPRDEKVIGAWSYQNVISSNGMSVATALYFVLENNGRFMQYSKGVGGGSDWSYSSGDAELVQQGTWYTDKGTLYLKPEGTAECKAGATYQFFEGKLVTTDVNGQKIWYRQ